MNLNFDMLIFLVGGLALIFLLVVFFRGVTLWYLKIDERIKNQQTIIQLLKKINENLESK